MSFNKKVIAAALALVSTLALADVAQAYPAGSAPTMSISNYANLVPGQGVNVVIARVRPGCSVAVGWDVLANPQVHTADSFGHASFTNVTSPTTGSRYDLTATFGAGCYSDQGTFITRSIVVGKQLKQSAIIKTSTRAAARNPLLTVTGKITWGVTPVSGLTVQVRLRKGSSFYSSNVTTNSSGVYTAVFGRGNVTTIPAGNYWAYANIPGTAVYANQTGQTPTIHIN